MTESLEYTDGSGPREFPSRLDAPLRYESAEIPDVRPGRAS